MRVAIYVDKFDAFTEKYLSNLLKEYDKKELTIYAEENRPNNTQNSKNLEYVMGTSQYLFKTSSPKMYEKFFEYLDENPADRVIVIRLHHPEYFLLEAITRRNQNNISISFFGSSEIANSKFRQYLIPKFLKLNPNNFILIHSNNWFSENNLEIVNLLSFANQITFMSDPVYEDPDTYTKGSSLINRTKLSIPDKSIVVLYFGSMFFGKGPDILFASAQYLPDNYCILFAGSSDTINFDFLPENVNEKIVIYDKFIQEDEIGDLFALADLICLPYRKSYINGTSGVLVQSALAKKPVIAPMFAPFTDVFGKFQFGVTFEPEDAVALATSIKSDQWTGLNLKNCQDYLTAFDNWHSISTRLLHGQIEPTP